MFRAAAADRYAHILIGRRLVNETRELPHARNRFAVEPQDYVVFAQTGLLCRTVFCYFRYADAAHFTHAIARHVFFGDVFGADAEKGAAVEKERKASRAGLLRAFSFCIQQRAQSFSLRTGRFLGVHNSARNSAGRNDQRYD